MDNTSQRRIRVGTTVDLEELSSEDGTDSRKAFFGERQVVVITSFFLSNKINICWMDDLQ
jgi:hypothetical protein